MHRPPARPMSRARARLAAGIARYRRACTPATEPPRQPTIEDLPTLLAAARHAISLQTTATGHRLFLFAVGGIDVATVERAITNGWLHTAPTDHRDVQTIVLTIAGYLHLDAAVRKARPRTTTPTARLESSNGIAKPC